MPENDVNWNTIHQANNALLLYGLEHKIEDLPLEVAKAQQYADLAGENESEYARAQKQISAMIGKLKQAHKELGLMAHHQHEWSENDYCNICGADGRA